MRAQVGLLTLWMLHCTGDSPVGSATEATETTEVTTSSGTTTEMTTSTSTTSTATGPGGSGFGCGVDYGPCEKDAANERCIHSQGASVCGAQCAEYGPGPASGRCEESPLPLQSVCPVTREVPAACLILCKEASDCPYEGMVCVPCPEPFFDACWAFSGWAMMGPNLCAWPDP